MNVPLLEQNVDEEHIHDLVRRIHSDASQYAYRTDGLYRTDLFYDMFPLSNNGVTYWWIPTNHPIAMLLYTYTEYKLIQNIDKYTGSVTVWHDDAVFDIINYIVDTCKHLGLMVKQDPIPTTTAPVTMKLEHKEVVHLDDVVVSFESNTPENMKNK